MDMPMNAQVFCTDGAYGRSSRVILNPEDKRVTHIVVKENGQPCTERVIPIKHITETTPSKIRLDCSTDEAKKLDPFIAAEHVDEDAPEYQDTELKTWPNEQIDSPRQRFFKLRHEAMPVKELALQKGARVKAKDGYVGQVQEFLVNPKNGQITHLVLHKGYLWGQKDILIDMTYVERIEEKVAYLKLEQFYIDKLPTMRTQQEKQKGTVE